MRTWHFASTPREEKNARFETIVFDAEIAGF
jgi:hypothetical protein